MPMKQKVSFVSFVVNEFSKVRRKVSVQAWVT
jgi:hypothetical protein